MKLSPTRDAIELVMQPQLVKAAYLTYFGIGDKGIRGRVLDLAARTELNAVVIDVKGDRGWIVYRTEVPQALAVGAQGPATLKDFDGLMAKTESRGIYTIGRIVTFKETSWRTAARSRDHRHAHRPALDRQREARVVDPFRERSGATTRDRAASPARDSTRSIRLRPFPPTASPLAAAALREVFGAEHKTTRSSIHGFLGMARRELGRWGCSSPPTSSATRPFNENDTDIASASRSSPPHLDYLCPMGLSSGYHVGIPGFRNPSRTLRGGPRERAA